jgi:hypothetical protein
MSLILLHFSNLTPFRIKKYLFAFLENLLMKKLFSFKFVLCFYTFTKTISGFRDLGNSLVVYPRDASFECYIVISEIKIIGKVMAIKARRIKILAFFAKLANS